MILILALCALVIYVFVSWINLIIDSKKINVPGPFPIPVLGNGHLLITESTGYLNVLWRLSKQYGDAVRYYVLSTRYITLYHPKYIEPVLSSTEILNKGESYSFLLPWLKRGLLTSTGEKWRSHRKFLTPAFHFSILQTFLPIFSKNDAILIKKLRKLADGKTDINLFPIITLAALDNAMESIMGITIKAQEDNESLYVKAIEDFSQIMNRRLHNPLLASETIFNLSPYKKKQDKILEVLHGHTHQVIETRRRELEESNTTEINLSSESGMKNRRAFLDLLLLGEINGQKLDNESIREEVDTFMFAGHDTTTSSMVYSLYCISKNSDVQEKILNEQISIFGDDLEREPTFQEVQQMKYLELVIKESLRLYPSATVIERVTTRDTEIAGLQVPKHTTISIDIFHMQRRPDLYEDPEVFRPERFETTLKNAYNWLAFSAGPRNCIGQKFAMLEMKVILSAIVRNFKILPSDYKVSTFVIDLVLKSPEGVYVKLLPRV